MAPLILAGRSDSGATPESYTNWKFALARYDRYRDARCSDGFDNDSDGRTDFGNGGANDPGCDSATDDDESNARTLSITDVTKDEGDPGEATTFAFEVSLSEPAEAGGVSFDIATSDGTAEAGDDYEARSLTAQTIPAGSTSYTFEVTVAGDDRDEQGEGFFVDVTEPSGASADDSEGEGTITDDDTAGITLNPTEGLTTTEAGGTATFTVVLDSRPASNVTIPLSSSDTTEGAVSPVSLTFTPDDYDAETVTVTGVNDGANDGDVGYMVVTGAATSDDTNYSGRNAQEVSVTNNDDGDPPPDTAAPTVTRITPAGRQVFPTSNVTATFSESINETSVEAVGVFKLVRMGTRAPVGATVTYDAATKKLTLNPRANLKRGATYTATISTGAKDSAGNAMARPKTWSFRIKP